jgi:hypothetical protein
MSAETWLEDNSRYLGASLHWLRLRLMALARLDGPTMANGPAAPVPPPPTKPARPGMLGRWTGSAVSTAPTTVLLIASSSPMPDETAIAQAAAAREAAANTDPPPALVMLAAKLGLSTFERDTVLLCAAAELDPGVVELFAAVPGSGAHAYPTFALALQVLAEPIWDALSPHRPLRYLRLLEINQPGATPLTAAALRADERVVNLIKGLNEPDERLTALLVPLEVDASHLLAASQQLAADELEARIRGSADANTVPIAYLIGVDTGSKHAVAARVVAGLRRRAYRVALDVLPVQRAELELLARLWQRESLLLPLALYIDAEDFDAGSRESAGTLPWFLSRDLGLVLVGVREPLPRVNEHSVAIEVGKPAATEQRDAWVTEIQSAVQAPEASEIAAQLAGQFDLNLDEIHRIAATETASSANTPIAARLWDGCCALTRPRLDQLAQRIEPKATWDDLVLGAEALALLPQIGAQVRGRYQVYQDWGYAKKMTRGMGISALFAGESGTGKTMAAEVLANELRLALYRIDLSAVVSKYIGETEKNLRKLFDAAEQGGAILFFDEADALFGKRSEVKDSHDRYANIEINYLLQRMESFSGLAILATNMKNALDPAFMRRLRFIVNFPFPSAVERKQIWQKAFAPDVPRGELDYDHLARFNLSGGNIHGIALNAAFAAARRQGTERIVTMPLVLAAIRSELRKLDKQVNEADLSGVRATRGAA